MTPNISLGAGHEITVPLKRWIFRIPLTDYRLSPLMLQFTVNKLGARKIALLHSRDASGMMGAKGIMDTIDQYKGASIAITEEFEPQDTTMIPQLTKIKAAKPDAIILYTSAAPAAVVAKNWQQLGMEKTIVIGSHGIPTADFTKLAGKIVEGGQWVLFGSKDSYGDQISPSDPWRKNIYEPFKKALKEKYGKDDYQPPYGTAHEALHIAVEAIKIAGTDDRAALRDALEKVKYEDGMIGDYAYSPTDHDGLAPGAYGPMIVKDMKWRPYKN
jgi:branched-chain amino acid transport system substrate-binding protein